MTELINEFAEVKVNPESSILSVKFLERIPLDEFKKVLQFEYEQIGRYKMKKALIDLRQMPVYPAGAVELIKTEWFPKITSLGLRYIAFVQPESVIAKLSMTSAHKEENASPVTMNHFGSTDEAVNWLNAN
jgi:hypothetical protein